MATSVAAGIVKNDHEPSAVPTMNDVDEKGVEQHNSNSDTDSQDKEEQFVGLTHQDTSYTTFDGTAGTARLFQDGEIVLMPAPTKDPRDPLNMSNKKKFLGLFCLCFFGALAASAELILGAMLPVFALQYADVDPKVLLPLTAAHALPAGVDPLVFLSELPGAPPIWHTYLLGSMPLLVMGLSQLFMIPLAIAIGRRPVVLLSGVIAIVGACWAGGSNSLGSHIGARCLQAVGAGTVESLIPFILQDCVFFHQRNTAISGVFAAQGLIIIALGVAAPHMIIYLSWRYVYFITAAGAAFFLVGVILFMPETRWYRTKAEMNGVPRPESEEHNTEKPSLKYNLVLQRGPLEWKKGVNALFDSLTTFFYPHIFFITMLNSIMIAVTFASAFTVSPALLSPPYNWGFLNLGLCLIPVIIAAIAVAGVTGKAADVVANYMAKKRGRRLPENQLINLVFPTICGLIGSILFGLAGDNPDKYPWPIFLLGLGLQAFGFLGANTVGAVYVLEAYPQLAGPALVNIASFRLMIAFAISFKVTEWIVDNGYLFSYAIYTGVMGAFFIAIPFVFVFGPSWRKRWPGPDRW